MKRWPYLIIPLIILALVAWRLVEKGAESAAQSKQRLARLHALPVVSVSVVGPRTIAHVFEGTGTVEAPLTVRIAPKVTGRIVFLQAHEGDRVRKGQLLLGMDRSAAQAEVRQASGAVAEARNRLAQAELTQSPTNVSVDTQIQQQKAAVISAKADYDQAAGNYNAQVRAATAAVVSAQAGLDNANVKYDRVLELYRQGFIAAQDVDDARTTAHVQQTVLDAAKEQLDITKTNGKTQVEDSRSKLEQATNALTLAKSNIAQKPAYQRNLDALNASVMQAQESLRDAQSRLADTYLWSPVDGFVTGRFADPGSVAIPGQVVLQVQFIRSIWVTVAVPEEVSTYMRLGSPATVTLDGLPGMTFEGRIVQVNQAADVTSRQFMVRVVLGNERNLLKPGMFCHVSIVMQQVKAPTAVPREAILRDREGAYAIVVGDGGKVEHRKIEAGMSDADYTAVNRGLRPGERVVVSAAITLRAGQSVRIGAVRRGQESPAGGAPY